MKKWIRGTVHGYIRTYISELLQQKFHDVRFCCCCGFFFRAYGTHWTLDMVKSKSEWRIFERSNVWVFFFFSFFSVAHLSKCSCWLCWLMSCCILFVHTSLNDDHFVIKTIVQGSEDKSFLFYYFMINVQYFGCRLIFILFFFCMKCH